MPVLMSHLPAVGGSAASFPPSLLNLSNMILSRDSRHSTSTHRGTETTNTLKGSVNDPLTSSNASVMSLPGSLGNKSNLLALTPTNVSNSGKVSSSNDTPATIAQTDLDSVQPVAKTSFSCTASIDTGTATSSATTSTSVMASSCGESVSRSQVVATGSYSDVSRLSSNSMQQLASVVGGGSSVDGGGSGLVLAEYTLENLPENQSSLSVNVDDMLSKEGEGEGRRERGGGQGEGGGEGEMSHERVKLGVQLEQLSAVTSASG